MKKNVFGLLGLLGALIFASCTNPMIASGSEDEETASTPEVQVVAAPETYVVGQSSSLIATVTGTGKGKVGYQWYKVTGSGETEKAEAIEGATEYKYTSSEATAGKYVYYVTVSNTLKKSIKTADSARVEVTVTVDETPKSAQIPTVTLAKDKTSYVMGGTVKLAAAVKTTDNGTITYKWYKDGKVIADATEATYDWENADDGTYVFKVEVTNSVTSNMNNVYTASNFAEISVTVSADPEPVDAVVPVFKYAFISKRYDEGATTVSELNATATVTDGGVISYAWYTIDDDGKETALNHTKAKYTPSVETAGVTTYKVVATNTNNNATGKQTADASMSVIITVVKTGDDITNAATPIITKNPVGAVYTIGDTVTALTVEAKLPADAEAGNELKFQWYKNDKPIEGATTDTYTPSSSEVEEANYKVRVISYLEKATGLKTTVEDSTVAKVIVNDYEAPVPVIIEQPVSAAYLLSDIDDIENLTVVTDDVSEGQLHYKWYQITADGEKELPAKKQLNLTEIVEAEGSYQFYVAVTNIVTKAGKEYKKTIKSAVATIVVTNKPIRNAEKPVFRTTLAAATYKVGATATILDGYATVSDNGKVTWQWYKVVNGTDEIISGETESSLEPDTTSEGVVTYKVRATNTNDSEEITGLKTAENEMTVVITVVGLNNAETPKITKEPVGASYNLGSTIAPLTVEASVSDGGTLHYQWYKGTEKVGTDSPSYTPVFTEADEATYYVVVTNVNNSVDGNKIVSKDSDKVIVKVTSSALVNAVTPVIKTQPVGKEYVIGETAIPLTVVVEQPSDGGTLHYKWYKGTEEVGTDSASYTPDVSSVNSEGLEYQVVVTNHNESATGNKDSSVTSEKAVVKVVAKIDAKAPVITTHPVSATYGTSVAVADMAVLSVAAQKPEDQTEGSLSYQWYKDGTPIENATSETYTLTDPVAGTYYVVVTNTYNKATGEKTAQAQSSSAVIQITDVTVQAPTVTPEQTSYSYKQGGKETLKASVTGYDSDAVLTAKWFKDAGTEPVATSTLTKGASSAEATLEVSGTETGTFSYYLEVVATRTVEGESASCNPVRTGAIGVTVQKLVAPAPTLSALAESATYVKDAETVSALSVTVSGLEGGSASYQWFSKASSEAETGTAISGATSDSYTPDVSVVGTKYYYVEVSNTITNGTFTSEPTTVKSTDAAIIVTEPSYRYAATPVFANPLVAATYTQGDDVTPLDATATATSSGMAVGGNPTYQWYSNTTASNEGGTEIDGATSATYTPEITVVGSVYYYCEAINTVPADTEDLDPTKGTAKAKTNAVEIKVNQLTAKKPIAGINASATTYTIGSSTQVVLTATCTYESNDTGKVGTLEYQWYEVSGSNKTPISGATSATYTIPTDVSEGDHSYTVIITNKVTTEVLQASDAAESKVIKITASTGTGGITINFN